MFETFSLILVKKQLVSKIRCAKGRMRKIIEPISDSEFTVKTKKCCSIFHEPFEYQQKIAPLPKRTDPLSLGSSIMRYGKADLTLSTFRPADDVLIWVDLEFINDVSGFTQALKFKQTFWLVLTD
jgi:hypothetical protein